MSKRENITTFQFTRCITSLSSLLIDAGQQSALKKYLQYWINKLIINFVDFQKEKERRNGSPTPPSPIYVAQYRKVSDLIIYITDTLEMLRNLNFINDKTSLPVIKDLLILRKIILFEALGSPKPKKKKEEKEEATDKKIVIRGAEKDLYESIKKSESPMSNQEILKNFSDLSTRTVRRYLGELIKKGLVSRRQEGREVLYFVTS